jgi:hypothetical protein
MDRMAEVYRRMETDGGKWAGNGELQATPVGRNP